MGIAREMYCLQSRQKEGVIDACIIYYTGQLKEEAKEMSGIREKRQSSRDVCQCVCVCVFGWYYRRPEAVVSITIECSTTSIDAQF